MPNFFGRVLETTLEEPGASIVPKSVPGMVVQTTHCTVTPTSPGYSTPRRIQKHLSGARCHKSSLTESCESNGRIRISGKERPEILFGGGETTERGKFNVRMKLTVV